MTVSLTYRAPFAPDGSHPIDAATCEKLLATALANGGDYADLFFEYRAGGGLSFDEGILKSASRGVSLGVGVRVQRGDATGHIESNPTHRNHPLLDDRARSQLDDPGWV